MINNFIGKIKNETLNKLFYYSLKNTQPPIPFPCTKKYIYSLSCTKNFGLLSIIDDKKKVKTKFSGLPLIF